MYFSSLRFFLHIFLVCLGLVLIGYDMYFSEQFQSPEKTIWVIDVSLSMAVEDIKNQDTYSQKNRLDVAKMIAERGRESISGGHALVAYARESALVLPFSGEKGPFFSTLSGLTLTQVYGGSDLASALGLVKYIYGDTVSRIVILTDGGLDEHTPLPDMGSASIDIVAIGTLAGDRIPLGYDSQGARRYKYYEGKEVIAGLEEGHIRALAKKYSAHLHRIEKISDVENVLFSGYREIAPFHILKMIGICVLCFAILLHPYVSKK